MIREKKLAFEQIILIYDTPYLRYALKYGKSDFRLTSIEMCYWRSTSRFEVDLILNDRRAIEIKGSTSIQNNHLKGLRALKEEDKIENFAVVSCDRYEITTPDGIRIFPWELFLVKLWSGEII